jgi:short-subunit dehydrogenase
VLDAITSSGDWTVPAGDVTSRGPGLTKAADRNPGVVCGYGIRGCRARVIEPGALMTGTPTPEPNGNGAVGTVNRRHVLLVGAGPGLGLAVARRFAVGGYQVTLVARSTDGLRDLASRLSDTGAAIRTVEADASDPEGLGVRVTELYREEGAPGVIIYNAVMGAPDQLLSASVSHLQAAYAVDVISAIVVAQVAAPAWKAAGFGTMIVTGGGFADHPIPALATVSLGKAALRSAATMLGADLEPDGIRVTTLTSAGQIVAGTSFDPERIAERYWEVVHSDGPWQAEVRFTGD